jgi:hypothetical protein
MSASRIATPTVALGVAGIAMALLLPLANADERRARSPANPAFLAECGSCHVPYPPKLLSAPAWRNLVNGLVRHFGVDASLDAETAAAIGSYLQANAASPRKVSPDPTIVRVTDSPRFVRKHAAIPASAWQSPQVQSAANCGACHPDAREGRFGHDARVPRF